MPCRAFFGEHSNDYVQATGFFLYRVRHVITYIRGHGARSTRPRSRSGPGRDPNFHVGTPVPNRFRPDRGMRQSAANVLCDRSRMDLEKLGNTSCVEPFGRAAVCRAIIESAPYCALYQGLEIFSRENNESSSGRLGHGASVVCIESHGGAGCVLGLPTCPARC